MHKIIKQISRAHHQVVHALLLTTLLISVGASVMACSDEDNNNGVLSILFEKSSADLDLGGSEQPRIKVIVPGAGVSQTDWYDLDTNPLGLSWTSGNQNTAEVDKQGHITAKQSGHTNVTVTAPNGVYARTTVTVIGKAVFDKLTSPLNSNLIYSKGVQLQRNAVMQCFDVCSDGELYYVQVAGSSAHMLHIQRAGANQSPTDFMSVRWFGHGTNMAIEEQGDDRYIWLNSNGNKLDDNSYSQSQTVSRFKYEADKTLDYYAGDTFYIPGKRNVHPAIDVASDMLAITASTTGVRDFYIYKLSEALALPLTEIALTITSGGEAGTEQTTEKRTVKVHQLDKLTPIASFTINTGKTASELGYYDFQGFDCQNGVIYFYEGIASVSPAVAYVTLLNTKGKVIYPRTKVVAIADKQALASLGITTTGYMEAEGIKFKDGSLWLGFASKSSDDVRRAVVLRY